MNCSKEQFNKIRPKLEKANYSFSGSFSFEYYHYLTNNYNNNNNNIGNIHSISKNDYNRTVFEEWNEKIFLEYCDIKSVTLDDAYIVKCDNGKESDEVARFIKQDDYNWGYYKYVINHKCCIWHRSEDNNFNAASMPQYCLVASIVSSFSLDFNFKE